MKDLSALARNAYTADQKAKEAAKQAEQAKTEFVKALQEAGKYNNNTKVVGAIRTKISPNRKFNAEKALKYLTEEQYINCLVTRLDEMLIKRKLTPEQLEESMDFHKNPYKMSLELNKENY